MERQSMGKSNRDQLWRKDGEVINIYICYLYV